MVVRNWKQNSYQFVFVLTNVKNKDRIRFSEKNFGDHFLRIVGRAKKSHSFVKEWELVKTAFPIFFAKKIGKAAHPKKLNIKTF